MNVEIIPWPRKLGLFDISTWTWPVSFYYLFATIHIVAWFVEGFFVIFYMDGADVTNSFLGLKFAGHAVFVMIIQSNCNVNDTSGLVVMGMIGGFGLIAWGQLSQTIRWPEIAALCLTRAISATLSCVCLFVNKFSTEIRQEPVETFSEDESAKYENKANDKALRKVSLWLRSSVKALCTMFILLQVVLFVFYTKDSTVAAQDAIGFHFAFFLPFSFGMLFFWGTFEVAATGFFALTILFSVGIYVFRTKPGLLFLFILCTLFTALLFISTLKLIYYHMKARREKSAVIDVQRLSTPFETATALW